MTKKHLIDSELQKLDTSKLEHAKNYSIIVTLYSWSIKKVRWGFSKQIKDRIEYLRRDANRAIRSNAEENLDHNFSIKNIKSVEIKIS